MQSLWDPGQQVIPQGVINGDTKISGAGQKGGLGAAAAHTQHIGDTQRGQAVLHTHTHTYIHTHTHTHGGKHSELLALIIKRQLACSFWIFNLGGLTLFRIDKVRLLYWVYCHHHSSICSDTHGSVFNSVTFQGLYLSLHYIPLSGPVCSFRYKHVISVRFNSPTVYKLLKSAPPQPDTTVKCCSHINASVMIMHKHKL